ncbi:unnamed protein product [Prunus armeniaca]
MHLHTLGILGQEGIASLFLLGTQLQEQSKAHSNWEPNLQKESKSKKEAQLQLDSPTDNSHLLHATARHAEAGGHLW